MTDGVRIDTATVQDLPYIMTLERRGFAVELVERQAVFRRRLPS